MLFISLDSKNIMYNGGARSLILPVCISLDSMNIIHNENRQLVLPLCSSQMSVYTTPRRPNGGTNNVFYYQRCTSDVYVIL